MTGTIEDAHLQQAGTALSTPQNIQSLPLNPAVVSGEMVTEMKLSLALRPCSSSICACLRRYMNDHTRSLLYTLNMASLLHTRPIRSIPVAND